MRLNKFCEIEDWQDPALVATMRRICPYHVQAHPDYPAGQEHRKHWEFAHGLNGLEQLGAVHPQAWALSVAGGREEPAYDLTNRVRWVFLTDLYGQTSFSTAESPLGVLTNPDSFATLRYNRNRLVVEQMDALDLRFEADTFDIVFSFSSIEHFGGLAEACKALAEMERVVKPGGVVALTTEAIFDNAPDYLEGNLYLFSHDSLQRVLGSAPQLQLVEPIDFSVSAETMKSRILFREAQENSRQQRDRFPHIVLEHSQRLWSSLSVFLRKKR